MNFVADEGVDRSVVERLRVDGHEVAYVAEFAPSSSDQQILAMANEEGAMLLTADMDFGDLVFRQGLIHAGVVLLRLAGLRQEMKCKVVSEAVGQHGGEMHGAFTVIAPGRMRIRRRVE